jgi:hypothetical protein
MASTYSNLKIQLMGTGENSGTWGNVTNVNLGTAIEQALVETATVTFASATVTLTLTDTNAAQDARALRLNLTGTSGGPQDLVVPAIQKPYIVNNGTADTITVKVSGQTGVAVPAGSSYLLYNNGTDVVNALEGISVTSGGTGLETLTADSVVIGNGTDAVTFVAPGASGNVLTSNGTNLGLRERCQQRGTLMSSRYRDAVCPNRCTDRFYERHITQVTTIPLLRVVTGIRLSTGGSVDFTTAFASQTPTGSVSITAVSGSAGNTTLSTPQIPSHTHTLNPGWFFSDQATVAQVQPVEYKMFLIQARLHMDHQLLPVAVVLTITHSHSQVAQVPLVVTRLTWLLNMLMLFEPLKINHAT